MKKGGTENILTPCTITIYRNGSGNSVVYWFTTPQGLVSQAKIISGFHTATIPSQGDGKSVSGIPD